MGLLNGYFIVLMVLVARYSKTFLVLFVNNKNDFARNL